MSIDGAINRHTNALKCLLMVQLKDTLMHRLKLLVQVTKETGKIMTERELDLENLKRPQETNKIGKDEDLEEIANLLPKWRKSNEELDKAKLARYGRDCGLDRLVYDEFRFVRQSVADRGRDKDLDILVNDKDWDVRWKVASQGRKQDVYKLGDDSDDRVWPEVMPRQSNYIIITNNDLLNKTK